LAHFRTDKNRVITYWNKFVTIIPGGWQGDGRPADFFPACRPARDNAGPPFSGIIIAIYESMIPRRRGLIIQYKKLKS
jgi:hypothetical protein